MALFVFVRIHARLGQEHAVEQEVHGIVRPAREEPGCVSIRGFRTIRDPQLFYILSVWVDEAAFEHHATLSHTQGFMERVDLMLDQPREVARTRLIDPRDSENR